MIPDLTGQTIQTIRARRSLTLWTTQGWQVALSGETTFLTGADAPAPVETTSNHFGPPDSVAHLIGRSITAVSVGPDGALQISFGDSESLRAQASPGEVAWTIDGPDGQHVASQPGGTVLVATPKPGVGKPAVRLPDLRNTTITCLSLSNTLKIVTSNAWEFSLEGTIQLTIDGQGPYEVTMIHSDPVEDPEELASLLGAPIVEVALAADGQLTIDVPGTRISVAPDPHFETWQLHGPNGEAFVCGPRGQMSVWS